MAQLLLGSLVLLLSHCVFPVPATRCYKSYPSYRHWTCPSGYECCYSEPGCCQEKERASYGPHAPWYAWLLIALFLLTCACCCISCGTYYKIHHRSTGHVVRRIGSPSPSRGATGGTRAAVPAASQPSTTAPDEPYSPHGFPKDPSPSSYTPCGAPPPYHTIYDHGDSKQARPATGQDSGNLVIDHKLL